MKKNYDELVKNAIEMLEQNDDLFCEVIDELDSYNGFADGFRCYPMYELNDLFCDCKVSDFLDKLADDFCHTDEYFCDTIYGISSTNDKASYYRDNTTSEEVFDNLIDNFNHVYFDETNGFEELIDEIVSYNDEDGEN